MFELAKGTAFQFGSMIKDCSVEGSQSRSKYLCKGKQEICCSVVVKTCLILSWYHKFQRILLEQFGSLWGIFASRGMSQTLIVFH
jgi:hypothetical protein